MRAAPLFLTLCMAVGLAQAAPQLRGPQAERYQAGVREAGKTLNTSLTACRDEARRAPAASRRELKDCERTARAAFRQDLRQARVQARRADPA